METVTDESPLPSDVHGRDDGVASRETERREGQFRNRGDVVFARGGYPVGAQVRRIGDAVDDKVDE